MSCCIGGVCIPYTAIVPMLLLSLKWVANKFAELGLLPSSVIQMLGLSSTTTNNNNNNNNKSECCNNNNNNNNTSTVVEITSMEQWKDLTSKKEWMVVKFTATWCKPCQAISPTFSKLSTKYQHQHHDAHHFCEVDVDDWDEIASKYNVAMMPTFVWLLGETEMDRMTGSNPGQLEQLVDKHLGKRKE